MKVLLIIISLFTTIHCFCQSESYLDTRYGMKKFKLESPYSNYSNELEYVYGDKVKYYKYLGNDITSLFDERIEEIIIGFYKNKLYYIRFVFDNSIIPKTDLFYNNLKGLFGYTERKEDFQIGTTHFLWANVWETQKVHLQFDRYRDNDERTYKITLRMTSQLIEQQIKNDDF